MDTEMMRWIWLVAGVALLTGEMATAGFFLLPFAIGAFAAAVVAFVGAAIAVQVIVCFVVSLVAFAALRPLAARLDRSGKTAGIGSRRLVDELAVVIDGIPANDLGMIRVGREEWRAQAVDGRPIAEGTEVRIIDVRGTRAFVAPADVPHDQVPPLPN